MIKLHIVQAEYGDCFIIESKVGKNVAHIMIDGGPSQTFENHLKPTLEKLLLHGKLDLMVLSHIDNDHIIGLLDLLEEIKNQRESGTKELVKVEKMWHNSFVDLLQLSEQRNKLIENFFTSLTMLETRGTINPLVMKGFQQGTDLTKLARLLKIPINVGFNKIIIIKDKIRSIQLGDLTLQLLGPTKENIDNLQKEWKNWLSKKKTVTNMFGLVQVLDKSVPNLASITFLAETKNRKILFTGDGVGQDIVDILKTNARLDKNGKFYVDVLKVPHHGSERNTSPEFFTTINAKYYVISANGRDDNPSLCTLRWIIESGNRRGIRKKIVLTNMTPNVKTILQEYDQIKYNYDIVVLENKSHFMTIDLK